MTEHPEGWPDKLGEPINKGIMIRCRLCGHTQFLPPGGGQTEGCCEAVANWPADRAREVWEYRLVPSPDTAAMQ